MPGPNYIGILSDSGTHAITVTPGASVTVDVWAFNPMDETTGYDLAISGTEGFALVDRIPGWPFTDFLLATPSLSGDHGSVLENVSVAQGPGLYLLERLDLTAPANAGDYVLTPFSSTGIGVVGSAPGFDEWGWSRMEGLAVHVTPAPIPVATIPEPSGLLVVFALILTAFFRIGRVFQRGWTRT